MAVAEREISMPDHVRMVPVKDLVPYARNARIHTQSDIAQLAEVIKRVGWTNPIITDGRNGIMAGHKRLAAAQVLGLQVVPVIDVGHLSDEEKRAYILFDNKSTLNSAWELDFLKSELAELREAGFDLDMTGFSADEIFDLLGPVELPDAKDPDEVPEVPAEPLVSKLGDQWLLGAHRLRCGDSTDPAEWAALMQGELADIVWTDPPYNVDIGEKNKMLDRVGKGNRGKTGGIENDKMDGEQFLDFLGRLFSAGYAVMKPGATIYVAHADTEGLAFRSAFQGAGFHLSGCLIWEKNILVIGRSPYQWIHESILFGWKPGSRHRWYGGRKQTTVAKFGAPPFEQDGEGRWLIRVGDAVLVVSGEAQVEQHPSSIVYHDKPSRSALHPTTKPVGLIERQLRNSARPGDVVVDWCGGSGSTLVAAERLGMAARVMELDPRFADVICARYAHLFGRLPVHAETGATFPREVVDRLFAAAPV